MPAVPHVTSFDQAIGAIAWMHPEVAYAIRDRVRNANSARREDKIKAQAIAVAQIIVASGKGGIV
jgi:hypothetical protein